MSYQALYRVWRPQSFDELVGQEMIAQTLRNAIAKHQLSHAYLFSGPRGTGKTSVAKILAKAVNCPNSTDGNPCNECSICQGITSGEISDVIEIDAASNNGVDEIRDLRDRVRYAPTRAKNKVYIIDEVHMLTTGAFNALLKTLEEPPANVIFILATTEPHKIPATILSRTQRFDFQRIKDTDLIARMQYILDHEQQEYNLEALKVIARAANGGMRDALSLLDQAISYGQDRLELETALLVSGSFAQTVYVQYIQALAQSQVEEALQILEEQLQEGKQAGRFIEELILFARDTLLSLFSTKNHTLLTDQEFQPLKENIEPAFFYQLIDFLNQAQNKMRFSTQPEVYLEVMTVQLAQLGQDILLNEEVEQVDSQTSGHLEAQIRLLQEELEKQKALLDDLINNQKESTQVENNQTELIPRKKPEFAQKDYVADLHEIYNVLNQATKEDIKLLKKEWPAILAELAPSQRVRLSNTKPLAAGPDCALISFEDQNLCAIVQHDSRLIDQVNNIASQRLGKAIHFTYLWQADWSGIRSDYKILFERNGRKPIDLPKKLSKTQESITSSEETAEQLETVQTDLPDNTPSQMNQDNLAEIDKNEKNRSQNEELDSIEAQLPEPAEDVAALFQRSQINHIEEEEERPIIQPADGQTDFFDLEDTLKEENPAVQKAIELFGKENITIYNGR
ncbi:DNA polymerase III subunit gamma/tau [Facklamia sp. 7083-14-GEN3]|uniref:DNA polymerase III subunit gamma/tau n=1 Tax=Facklamia sp. 7083-14-GEN3 TaxID=2973478 RepID=UPI00215D453D|nr:DNA polymerase III subunit gamma/tau [Facklamia sp. 7083-14-GEN3]MCR8969928.1 DNA polymerase III subunit gamma/tau [Facklamia sp. 7083-14-GEN3]